MAFDGFLEQSTTLTITLGPFVDKDDGDTEKTGLTIQDTDVFLSKNGGAKGVPSDTNNCTEDANGIYRKQLNGTDTGTVGRLTVYVHFTDTLYIRQNYIVLDPEAYAGLVNGTAFGTDDKMLVSTDAQDLSATLDVNTKTITAAIIANASFNADVGSTAYATNIIALAVRKALDEIKLDHLVAVADADDPVDNSIIAKMVSKAATADWSVFNNTTESLEALRDRGDAAWTTGAGGSPPNLLQNTDIATLASQTSFTLTAGSADDDAYNECIIIVTDFTTATQKAVGRILNYTGASKTITLKEDPGIFVMAVTDVVDIIATDLTIDDVSDILADTNELQGDWVDGGRLDLLLDKAAGKYPGGAVFVDTVGGAAGTTSYVNGTFDNPSNSIANAKVIADALKMKRFRILPGSSITLAANYDDYTFDAFHAIVALGGSSVDNTIFNGGIITGNDDGSNPNPTQYCFCFFSSSTLGQFVFTNCYISGTITLAQAGDYRLHNCLSAVAGLGTPNLDFGVGIGVSNVNMRNFSGGIELENMGNIGADKLTYEGMGQIILNANCNPANSPVIAVRGLISPLTDNVVGGFVIGGGTISDDARYDTGQITASVPTAAEVVDEWETQSQADPTGFHVNVREWLDVAVTLSDNNFPDVNVNEISDDLIAPQNLELQYDTTGLSGDAFPARQDQLAGIANTGSAVNIPADTYVLAVGTQSSGTFANTAELDGTNHEHTDVGNAMDLYYEFTIGSGIPTDVIVTGYLNSNNDDLEVYGYDWVADDWARIGTLEGKNASTNEVNSYIMFVNMVGSGANEGIVRVRFTDGAFTLSGATLAIDQIFVSFSRGNEGYDNGAIWFDSGAGNTNTVVGIDGTSRNPVSTEAAVNTLLASTNLHRVAVAPGSTITFATSHDNQVWHGENWTLALGGQSVSATHIIGATVSGICTGASKPTFEHCHFGAVTMPPVHFEGCTLEGTLTIGSAGDFAFARCQSGVPGASTPILDFGALLNSSEVGFRGFSGGIEIQNMGEGTGTYLLTLEGDGQLVINANCTETSSVELRGDFKVTDSASGRVVVTRDDDSANIILTLADTNELQADWTDAGRLDAILDTIAADVANIDGIVPATPGDAMNLAADAIKAVSYDESTAFPIKSDDAGSTQIARVGADSDTLETLSDQIDLQATATSLTTHDNKLAPVALDGGGATIGGMLTKLADDSGGVGYDATTDSQEAIRNRGDVAWITAVDFNTVVPDVAGTAAGLHSTTDGKIDAIQTDIGDFSGRTNDQSLLEVLGVPDVVGKDLHTLLVTDRLDDATFGLSAIRTRGDAEWITATGFNTTTPDAAGTAASLHATTDALIVALNNLSAAQVNAQVDIALSDYDGPTKAEMDTAHALLATPAQVNTEMLDVMATDTLSLPGQGAPPLTPTRDEAMLYTYKQFRNKETQTDDEYALYDDAGITKDQVAVISDDNTTFTKEEMGSGA